MTTRRALRKRMRRRFVAGDVVTWGLGVLAHRVVEVTPQGVVVDSTSSGFGHRAGDGKLTIFVHFAPPSRSHRCPGPPRHSTMDPDRPERDR